VWIAPDDEGSLSELGVLQLLDRCEERVQVEVREDRDSGAGQSSVWHERKARPSPPGYAQGRIVARARTRDDAAPLRLTP
jgi:hypothetical protein